MEEIADNESLANGIRPGSRRKCADSLTTAGRILFACLCICQPSPGQVLASQNKVTAKAQEVLVPATGVDEHGEPILDLTQKDFPAFDNGVEQPIDHGEMGGESPTVALFPKTSSNIEMMAPVMASMGSILTEAVMAMNGEAAVHT
jgi:hypothetical protein